MLKATSVASTITILEVTGLSRQLVSATFAPYEVFVVAGAIYLATTLSITWLARAIERGLSPIVRH
jgi:octopine/nopaline transport system permease protein